MTQYTEEQEKVIEFIASCAHTSNKMYCEFIGDSSQPTWESAPEWQRASAIMGVKHFLENPNATPEQSHESWLKQKLEDGWALGEVKDPINKTHPCMVAYEHLPKQQQLKDTIFINTCKQFAYLVGGVG